MIQKYLASFAALMLYSMMDFLITAELIAKQNSYDVEANPILRDMMIYHDSVLPILLVKVFTLAVYAVAMWLVYQKRRQMVTVFTLATSTLSVCQAVICALGLHMLIGN